MKLHVAEQSYDVQYTEDPQIITRKLEEEKPKFFTFDTETTGLHIKKDRPFLGAICFNHVVFVFPTTEAFLAPMVVWSKMVSRVYAHNTTYDMHMVANVMGDDFPVRIKNWGDTQGLARLSFESLSTRDGGHRLALKYIGRKFIDPDADQWEKSVKMWISQEAKARRKVLLTMLKPFGILAKQMDEVLKAEGTFEDPDVQEIFEAWKQDYPPVTYQDVPMEIMLPYVAVDVILTQQLVYLALKVVVTKKQTQVMEREFKLIPVIYKMARVGFKIDRQYLLESKARIENYICKLEKEMCELAGREFTSGQHKLIKEIYTERLGEEPTSTDKKFLAKLGADGDRLATLISKMRTLEKWLSTYVKRILVQSEYDGRLYANLGQFNPVSGRFSGDFQQFPKEPLLTLEGDELRRKELPVPIEMELFHPRKPILVDGNGFDQMVLMDFSQVELRVGAHFSRDVNLSRAYMPYLCRHHETGEIFDPTTSEGLGRWNEKNGEHSAWVVPETGEPWVKTDVHTATTIKALPLMGHDPEQMPKDQFKMWRQIGKRYNFMKFYGGSAAKAAEVLEIALDEAKAINAGFEESFPGLLTYQDTVSQMMWAQGYVENLYGRRYYITDSWRFYKVANYLVQGTCGDDLKEKMIKIDQFLTENNCKSYMMTCIHDEIIYRIHNDEKWILPKLKQIMEYTPAVQIPIIAEADITYTNWAEKKGFEV